MNKPRCEMCHDLGWLHLGFYQCEGRARPYVQRCDACQILSSDVSAFMKHRLDCRRCSTFKSEALTERETVKKNYRVWVKEVWVQAYDIEATSKNEARLRIEETLGMAAEPAEDSFEYSHRLDAKEWKVEEMP